MFQNLPDTIFRLEIYFEAVLLGIIITGMPPYFAMDNAENHKVNSQVEIHRLQKNLKTLGLGENLELFHIVSFIMRGSMDVAAVCCLG